MNSSLDGTIAGAVLRAQSELDSLRTPAALIAAAEDLLAVAQDHGCPVLIPASPDGASLVGAAIVLGAGAVRSPASETDVRGAKVMVVEAVVVSGLSVRRLIETVRASGADWVGAYVWRVETPSANRPSDCGDPDVLLSSHR